MSAPGTSASPWGAEPTAMDLSDVLDQNRQLHRPQVGTGLDGSAPNHHGQPVDLGPDQITTPLVAIPAWHSGELVTRACCPPIEL